MPSLGADMTEGTLLEWLVKPGDVVHRGDIVAVVDTSKSAIDVEVFQDGRIAALVVEPGATVPVGTVLAVLDGADGCGRRRTASTARRRGRSTPSRHLCRTPLHPSRHP